MAGNTTNVTLGSGTFYKAARSLLTAGFDFDTIISAGNILGYTKGGAELIYKATIKEIVDDLKQVVRKYITTDSATLKGGILTWDPESLHEMIDSAYETVAATAEATGIKRLKLGGLTRLIPEYAIAFVHDIPGSGGLQIRVGLIGTNDGGITLKFDPEKETTVDPEFTAVAMDKTTGVLVVIEMDIPKTA